MPSGYASYFKKIGAKGGAAGKGSLKRQIAARKAAKTRWGHPDAEVLELSNMKFKCTHCGATNTVNVGSVLGSRTSEAKAEAARINASKPPAPGKFRGRPRKHPLPEKAPEVVTQTLPPTPAELKRSRGPKSRGVAGEPKSTGH